MLYAATNRNNIKFTIRSDIKGFLQARIQITVVGRLLVLICAGEPPTSIETGEVIVVIFINLVLFLILLALFVLQFLLLLLLCFIHSMLGLTTYALAKCVGSMSFRKDPNKAEILLKSMEKENPNTNTVLLHSAL